MHARFKNQLALITGGADGIGKHIATRLATEGAHVVLFDSNPDLLQQTVDALTHAGHLATATTVDISDPPAVAAAFKTLAEQHPQLHAVVHCAGIVGPNATKAIDVDPDDFDRVYAVNLRGTLLVNQHAARLMLPHGYGRILNFASVAGKEGNAGMHAYSATKAGVIGLTKSIGKELAETGVTVNAIAPAVVRTAMVDALDDWQVTYMTDKIPMKRCGTLDEVTALACWIISPEASFNTAATFDLTGGRATY